MLTIAQAIGMLVGGLLLIIILVWVLALVHTQSRRIRRIETQLNIVEKATKKENTDGKKDIL